MVNLELLKQRSLQAYEVGRLRTSARVALALIPMAALCLLEARGRQTCGCLAVVLLGLAVWMRWRDRAGVEYVTTGLLAGSIPMLTGLALARVGVDCRSLAAAPFCAALFFVVGGAAGVLIAVREPQRRTRLWSWLATGTVAALTASLGCVRLGSIGVSSVLGGVALGVAVAATIARRADR